MGDNYTVLSVEVINNFYIKITLLSSRDCLYNTCELLLGRLDQNQVRAECRFLGKPVRAGHGHGGRREEEELIHRLQDIGIGVKGEDPVVLCLVKGKQFRVALGLGN